jgi:riboflavin synthase alpha subunit
MEVTNLHTKQVGDLVNLEYDLIAKYVEKLFVPKD